MKSYRLKKLIEKHRRKAKLRAMDMMWRLHGGSCFSAFPPSFYYTHTPEEIKEIQQKNIDKLKEIAAEYGNSYH